MITITEEGDISYPNIRISDGTKSFLLGRDGFPDPVWLPDFHPINDKDDIKFIINKKDGEVYDIFNELYKNVIAGDIYFFTEKGTSKNQRKKNREKSIQTGLVGERTITWKSEDLDPIESSATLTIKKTISQIEIIFSKNKPHSDNNNYYPTYAVRLSQSWSRHDQFWIVFVLAHQKLQMLAQKQRFSINDPLKNTLESTQGEQMMLNLKPPSETI